MGYLSYSLKELSEKTGVEPRTIRNWIERGLIPGAANRGRYAQYGRVHLNRVLFIQSVRRAAKVPLDQIRQMLVTLPESTIVAVAEGREPVDVVDPEHCSPEVLNLFYAGRRAKIGLSRPREDEAIVSEISFQEDASVNRNVCYLDSNQEIAVNQLLQQSAEWADVARDWADVAKGEASTALERLVSILQLSAKGRQPQPRAKAEAWSSIPITPDVELRVRVGGMSLKELNQFETLADYLRNLLTHPQEDETDDE